MQPITMLLSPTGAFTLILLPIMAVQLFALLAIPSMLKGNASTVDLGHALFSYLCQTAGILLMTVGGLPTLYSVLGGQALSGTTYSALLLIFAVGGITYLWHDGALQRIDPMATAVPRMIFACSWKLLGLLLVLVTILSFALRIVFQTPAAPQGIWVMHLILLIYGILLTFASIAPPAPAHGGFKVEAMGKVKKRK